MIDQLITTRLRSEFEAESALHEPSGKLSAGYLGKPLLEQVLKVIGVPTKPVDDYVLRLFARGKQVEDWLLSIIEATDQQKEVEWKNTVGLVDGHLDGPLEVKSVKNSNLKWIKKSGAKEDHELQLTLYLLAENKTKGQIIYVSAEDFQTYTYDLSVEKRSKQVEDVIDEVYGQISKGTLPAFEARQDWHDKPTYIQYSNYPEWLSLEPSLAMEKLERQYPDSFRKLTKGAEGE